MQAEKGARDGDDLEPLAIACPPQFRELARALEAELQGAGGSQD